MDPAHFDELRQLEQSYWWHVAKRQLVTEILRREFPGGGLLVEGGIGSAGNLLAFRELGYDVIGLDAAAEAVEMARERGVTDVHQHDLSQPWPVPARAARVVVLLDVLEHLRVPAEALRHAAAALRPDGGVVVTVPAYPSLYGDWDQRLGHFRRYRSRDLREQADDAGLRVRWLSHWNAFTLPAALVSRGLDRVLRRSRPVVFPRVSRPVNAALLGLARVERWWIHRLGVPCGLSLVGVLAP